MQTSLHSPLRHSPPLPSPLPTSRSIPKTMTIPSPFSKCPNPQLKHLESLQLAWTCFQKTCHHHPKQNDGNNNEEANRFGPNNNNNNNIWQERFGPSLTLLNAMETYLTQGDKEGKGARLESIQVESTTTTIPTHHVPSTPNASGTHSPSMEQDLQPKDQRLGSGLKSYDDEQELSKTSTHFKSLRHPKKNHGAPVSSSPLHREGTTGDGPNSPLLKKRKLGTNSMDNESSFDKQDVRENQSTVFASPSTCPSMTSKAKAPTLSPSTTTPITTPLQEQGDGTSASISPVMELSTTETPREYQQNSTSMALSSTTSTPHSNVSYRNAFGGRVKNLDSAISSVGSKKRRRRGRKVYGSSTPSATTYTNLRETPVWNSPLRNNSNSIKGIMEGKNGETNRCEENSCVTKHHESSREGNRIKDGEDEFAFHSQSSLPENDLF